MSRTRSQNCRCLSSPRRSGIATVASHFSSLWQGLFGLTSFAFLWALQLPTDAWGKPSTDDLTVVNKCLDLLKTPQGASPVILCEHATLHASAQRLPHRLSRACRFAPGARLVEDDAVALRSAQRRGRCGGRHSVNRPFFRRFAGPETSFRPLPLLLASIARHTRPIATNDLLGHAPVCVRPFAEQDDYRRSPLYLALQTRNTSTAALLLVKGGANPAAGADRVRRRLVARLSLTLASLFFVKTAHAAHRA